MDQVVPSGSTIHTLTSTKKDGIETKDGTTLPKRDRLGELQKRDYNKNKTQDVGVATIGPYLQNGCY
ncbi:hypothetical protein J6590_081232, partial [Homalodisca vitripennis]